MIWLKAFCLFAVLCSAAYWTVSLGCTIAFFRRARRRGAGRAVFSPPVSILKPMRGLDADLEENLRAFAALDYPRFQIVFGVEDEDDPCVPVIRRFLGEFPDRDMTLVVCGPHGGANRKVNNLRVMMPHARHDLIALFDSDVRVGVEGLHRIVEPLADETVGLVCCPYLWKSPRSLPAAIEVLTFCVEFIPSVLLVERTAGLDFALGATVVVRRRCLEEIGGFATIQDYLADDYWLGKLIRQRGHKLALSDYVVSLIHEEPSWAGMWLHQLRLVRTYRACRPLGFFASVVTHGTSWASVFLCLTRGSPLGWAVWLAVLGLRFGAALALQLKYFPDGMTTGFLWLLPFRDWFASAWWLLAYTGNRVTWRGRSFSLTRDGKLEAVDGARPGSATGMDRPNL